MQHSVRDGTDIEIQSLLLRVKDVFLILYLQNLIYFLWLFQEPAHLNHTLSP